MSIVAAFDRVLFCSSASKYCVLRLKTADLMIPEDARSPYKFGDHLIRFVAVGYGGLCFCSGRKPFGDNSDARPH